MPERMHEGQLSITDTIIRRSDPKRLASKSHGKQGPRDQYAGGRLLDERPGDH